MGGGGGRATFLGGAVVGERVEKERGKMQGA